MSAPKTNTAKLCDDLYEYIMLSNYDDLLTHQDIANLLGLKALSTRYYSIINKVNKRLVHVGKKLESIHKVGYKILNPDYYAKHSTKIFISGANRIRDARYTMEKAPVKLMSKDAKIRHTMVSDRMKAFSASLDGGCVEIKVLQDPKSITMNKDRIQIK